MGRNLRHILFFMGYFFSTNDAWCLDSRGALQVVEREAKGEGVGNGVGILENDAMKIIDNHTHRRGLSH